MSKPLMRPEPGTVFGRVAILSSRRSSIGLICRYRCECGTVKSSTLSNLRRGLVKSCGCLRREAKYRHGHIRNGKNGKIHSAEYRAWHSMKQRCLNPRHKAFQNYGGRGISISTRWLDFVNFLQDMGLRPEGKTSIDRIDNSVGYFPGNCRWATQKEQMRNTRQNRLITSDGVTLSVVEWSERLGIPARRIHGRLKKGWSEQEAICP